MSERHACRLLELGRSTHRYRARKAERDAALRTRLKEVLEHGVLWRLHAGSRQTFEVVLSDRLRVGRSGSDATEL